MNIDYTQLNETQAVNILSGCLPLTVKLETEGYKTPLDGEEKELLISFKKLWLAGWLERGIHPLAGLSNNDIALLRAAMLYNLRRYLQEMHEMQERYA